MSSARCRDGKRELQQVVQTAPPCKLPSRVHFLSSSRLYVADFMSPLRWPVMLPPESLPLALAARFATAPTTHATT